MNITSTNQSVGFMPVSQSTQDSHEKNIQTQIINLQEKMRDITYNKEMSSEEKSDQKKALQEKIQVLNSRTRIGRCRYGKYRGRIRSFSGIGFVQIHSFQF